MGLLARRTLAAVAPLALAVLSVGCATSPSPAPLVAAEEGRSLGRSDAIARAREDAVASYGDAWIARTSAQYEGGFWLVELKDPAGAGLRYAISSRDGSIRQRAVIQ